MSSTSATKITNSVMKVGDGAQNVHHQSKRTLIGDDVTCTVTA